MISGFSHNVWVTYLSWYQKPLKSDSLSWLLKSEIGNWRKFRTIPSIRNDSNSELSGTIGIGSHNIWNRCFNRKWHSEFKASKLKSDASKSESTVHIPSLRIDSESRSGIGIVNQFWNWNWVRIDLYWIRIQCYRLIKSVFMIGSSEWIESNIHIFRNRNSWIQKSHYEIGTTWKCDIGTIWSWDRKYFIIGTPKLKSYFQSSNHKSEKWIRT